jgi:hypothetical protein
MFGKLVVLGIFSSVTFAQASDRPSCRDYCHGTTLYSNGYAQCVGNDCICHYSIELQSPKCPAPEENVKTPKVPTDLSY